MCATVYIKPQTTPTEGKTTPTRDKDFTLQVKQKKKLISYSKNNTDHNNITFLFIKYNIAIFVRHNTNNYIAIFVRHDTKIIRAIGGNVSIINSHFADRRVHLNLLSLSRGQSSLRGKHRLIYQNICFVHHIRC